MVVPRIRRGVSPPMSDFQYRFHSQLLAISGYQWHISMDIIDSQHHWAISSSAKKPLSCVRWCKRAVLMQRQCLAASSCGENLTYQNLALRNVAAVLSFISFHITVFPSKNEQGNNHQWPGRVSWDLRLAWILNLHDLRSFWWQLDILWSCHRWMDTVEYRGHLQEPRIADRAPRPTGSWYTKQQQIQKSVSFWVEEIQDFRDLESPLLDESVLVRVRVNAKHSLAVSSAKNPRSHHEMPPVVGMRPVRTEVLGKMAGSLSSLWWPDTLGTRCCSDEASRIVGVDWGGVKDGQPCVCNNENHRHLRCVENCGNQFTNWKEKMWHSPDEWNVGSWCSSTWKKAGELQKHERDELWRLITWLSLPTAPPPQDEWGIGSGNRMLSSPTCVDFWVAKINPCYQWPSKTRKTRGVA